MSPTPPEALTRLLAAQEENAKARAWEDLVAAHSRLIHSVARRSSNDYDGIMDRYSYVLERLREDDFRRLRGFDPNGDGKFSTWLVVVAARLCVDWHRKTYGRTQAGQSREGAEVRRKLADLVAERVGLEAIPARDGSSPESRVRQVELRDALDASLATLDSEARLMLRLRFEDERPMPEIARTLSLSSEFAAYRKLKATLKRLRNELGRRGVEGPRP